MTINFCGDFHTLNYYNFLKRHFDIKIEHNVKIINNNEPIRCIHSPLLNNVFPFISDPDVNQIDINMLEKQKEIELGKILKKKKEAKTK
jgi:hypothetical protein